jgi:hypothetical protein
MVFVGPMIRNVFSGQNEIKFAEFIDLMKPSPCKWKIYPET